MRVVVVSPHLDDAIFSLGGSIRQLADAGRQVEILTVFAGDPQQVSAPSYWDSARGFETAREATAARREEDRRACAVVGATARWLPFDDSGYVALRDPDTIWSAMSTSLQSADAVLIPGYPLAQYDHGWLAGLVVERYPSAELGFYVELPYAVEPIVLAKSMVRGRATPHLRHLTGGGKLKWRTSKLDAATLRVKRDAVRCYQGEIGALGVRAMLARCADTLFRREFLATQSDGTSLLEAMEPIFDG